MNGVGILAVLVGVAVIFVVMFSIGGKGSVGTALDVKKQAESEIGQVSGRDASGKPLTDTIAFESTPGGAVVTAIDAGGALQTQYGLMPGDVLVEIGPVGREQINSDSDAKAFLSQGAGRRDPLKIIRNGQRLTLPDQRDVGLAAAPQAVPPPPSTDTPPSATPPAVQPRTTPKGQALDLVNKIESH
ncbi:MAG TPA: hypothetical protein VF624_13315 [Tepidisphaeraceae bacterium]|jgi:hypothetical protein